MKTHNLRETIFALLCTLCAACSVDESRTAQGNSTAQPLASVHTFEFRDLPATAPCEPPTAEGVSIFSVYASPLAHSGRLVDIIGYLSVLDTQAYLFPSQDYAKAQMTPMGILLGDKETFSSACERGAKRVPTLAGCDGEIVAARGCFSYDGSFSFGVLTGELIVRPL